MRHQTISTCAIFNFTMLMMTGPEVLEDPENNQTNP